MQRSALIRVLTGAFAVVYLAVRLPYFADLSRHDASELSPVGVASFLRAPLPPAATWTIAIVALLSGIAFVRGVRLRASGIVFFLALLWVTTYRSSFGKVLHSENLLVLHVGVLAVAAWLDDEAWTVRTLGVATTLTYFVAGVTKLRAGGAAWLSGRALGDWLAFDALRKIELGSFHSPVAAWLAGTPALLVVLSAFTLAVELGAPAALVSPRLARAWAAAAWAFHLGVLVAMAIGFFYPLTGVAFASLLPVEKSERLVAFARRISGDRDGRSGRAPAPASPGPSRPARPR